MLKMLVCEPNLSRRDLDFPSHTSVFSSMEFLSTVLNVSFFVVLLRVRIIPSNRVKKLLAFDETSREGKCVRFGEVHYKKPAIAP